MKKLAFEGTHKLEDKWEDEPYLILDQPNPEVPVYVVRRESGQGKKRTLHRNNLLPIGSINEELSDENTPQRPVPRPRRQKSAPEEVTPAPVEVPPDSDNESDDESFMYVMMDAPQQYEQSDDNVPIDVEAALIEDEVNAPGNAGDGQDRTGEHDSGPEEDAPLPEDSGGSGLEQSQDQVEDASIIDDDPNAVNEQILDDDDDNEDDEHQNLTPQPRRSTRARTSTATTKYKDFVVSKSVQPDWMARAEYLRTAASSAMFSNMGDDVTRAMLRLITNTDD